MEDAIVVGAGQAGLGISWHLAHRGIPHAVLERGRVAETWRSQRWDSFTLNTPNWMNRLPGDAPGGHAPDAFESLGGWIARLDAYAAGHALPIRTGTEVVQVTRRADGTFDVEARRDGIERETITTRSVVVASGMLRVSRMPSMAARIPLEIVSIHAAGYRRPDRLPPGAVLVVGSGQSGAQIAEDLLDAGRTVHLSVGRAGRVRRRYRGRDSFEWLAPAGFWSQRLADLPDPTAADAPNPLISGTGPHGHSISLQWLARRGVRLLGHLRSVEGGRLGFADDVGASIRSGDEQAAVARRLMDGAIAAAGLDDRLPPPEDDPGDVPHPDPSSVRSPEVLDLDREGITSVIWTTGFGGRFDYLPPEALDGRMPRAAGVETPIPGLYVLGFPWLTHRGSGIAFGIDRDARLVADALAAHLATDPPR